MKEKSKKRFAKAYLLRSVISIPAIGAEARARISDEGEEGSSNGTVGLYKFTTAVLQVAIDATFVNTPKKSVNKAVSPLDRVMYFGLRPVNRS
jgi:hypothetical protein